MSRKRWTCRLEFRPNTPTEQVRRVAYWAALLMKDPGARTHMATYALPPASFRFPRGRRGTDGAGLMLATDEEIDDDGL